MQIQLMKEEGGISEVATHYLSSSPVEHMGEWGMALRQHPYHNSPMGKGSNLGFLFSRSLD